MENATDSRKLSRKEREHQTHRQGILEVAEMVFAQKGYHSATIEQIAHEAEFATGTIYNFFSSKEDLYSQVIYGIIQDFMDKFEKEVLSKDDPRDAIAALIVLRLGHFKKHQGFLRASFEVTPGSRISPELAIPPNCTQMYEKYIQQVTDIFRRGVESGIFDKLDPLYLTLSLQGVINAFAAYWAHRGLNEPGEADIEQLKNDFIARIQIKLSDNQTKRN
jgi:AcrR family transcriptional regulator